MLDIISIFIAGASLVVSVFGIIKSNRIHKQDMQEPLYSDVQRLLNFQCDYFSAENEVLGYDIAVPRVGRDEENTIIRRFRRCFGTKKYEQLCEILDLCKRANSINSDIKRLFDRIREENFNEYLELQQALEMRQQDISQDEYEKIQKFLATVYRLNESEPGKYYDYLDLDHGLRVLDKQIHEKKKILDQELQKIMKKR